MQKYLLSLLAILVMFAAVSVQAATPPEETVEIVTLQPNEKKTVSIDATQKTALGWEHTFGSFPQSELSKNCKNNCIKMIKDDGREMASLYGGRFKLDPKEGKVSLTFQNVEAVPIEIEIT